MTSTSDDFFSALHTLSRHVDETIPYDDFRKMLELTKLYFENPVKFRNEIGHKTYKGRNHLINSVRNGNVVWAKKVVDLLDGFDNFLVESSQFMGKECYICYESFEENHIVYKVPCNGHHIFHKHCIDKWVSINSTCPYCRDPIAIENITGFLNKCSNSGKNILYYAIKLGNLPFVEQLIKKGALVEYNHATPLHLAAGFGKPDLIAYCLSQGISLEATDERGRTPLYYAAKYAEPAISLFLLDQGAKFDLSFYHQRYDQRFHTNALLVALYRQNLTAVPFLIEYVVKNNLSLDFKDSMGHSALHAAVKHAELHILKLLFEKGATIPSIEEKGYHPLIKSIVFYDGSDYCKPSLEKFFFLLEKCDAKYLASEEKAEYLKFLSNWAVPRAFDRKNSEVVKKLFSDYDLIIGQSMFGIMPTDQLYQDLSGSPVFEKLLQHPSFFFQCIKETNIPAVTKYFEKGFDPLVQDEQGRSAAHFVQSQAMAELLDAHKVDFLAKTKKGENVFHTLLGHYTKLSESAKLSFSEGLEAEDEQPARAAPVRRHLLPLLNDDEDEEEPVPVPIRRTANGILIPNFRRARSDSEDEVPPAPVPRPVKKVVAKMKYLYKKNLLFPFFKEKGVDINELNGEGLSPLQINLLQDGYLVEALLKAGANPNECSQYKSPLHIVMLRGPQSTGEYQEKSIDLLFKYGVVPQETYDDTTPIHWAIYHNSIHMLTYLQDKFSVDLYDSYGRTPIALLFAKEHFKLSRETEYLIEEGWVDVNTPTFYKGKYQTLLELALQYGNLESVKYFLGKGQEFTYEILKCAYYQRNKEIFTYIFEKNTDALQFAAKKGYTKLLEFILKKLNREEIEEEEVEEEIAVEIEVDDDITAEEADNFIEAQDFDENARTIRLVRRGGRIVAILSR